MTSRLAIIGAIVKKDVLNLRMQTAMTVLVILLRPWYHLLEQLNVPESAGVTGAAFASLFLALGAIHADAAASVRHDWLTRPIRRLDLVIAKLAFISLAISLPWLLGEFAYVMLREGAPLGEALMDAAGHVAFATLALVLVAFCAVASNVGEAMIVLTIVMILASLGGFGSQWLLDITPGVPALVHNRYAWPVSILLTIIVAAGAVLTLWLQYGRRRTAIARTCFVATVLCVVVGSLTYRPVAAAMAPKGDTPSAALAAVSLAQGGICRRDDYGRSSADGLTVSTLWNRFEREKADPTPVVLMANATVEGAPGGWVAAMSRTNLRLQGGALPAGGANLAEGRTVRSSWLMTKTQADAIGPAAPAALDATISLLKPVRSWTFPDDGQRHRLPGLGYCGTKPGRRVMDRVITCRTGYPAPVLLTIRRQNAASPCLINCGSNPTPAWAQLPTTRTQERILPSASTAPLVATIYAPAGHVTRRLALPGPAATCPPPGPSREEQQRLASFGPNDADHDGRLNRTEYGRLAKDLGYDKQAEDFFRRRDLNRDGFISPDEYRVPLT